MPEPATNDVTVTLPRELLDALAEAIADRLTPRLPAAQSDQVPSPWMDFEAACAYLGFSRDSLYKLTAARAIPFRKKAGGQGLRFHRDELDAWMDQAYPRLDRPA